MASAMEGQCKKCYVSFTHLYFIQIFLTQCETACKHYFVPCSRLVVTMMLAEFSAGCSSSERP